MSNPPCEPGNWQARICALESVLRTVLSNEGHPPAIVTQGEEFSWDAETQTLVIPEVESAETSLPDTVLLADDAARADTAPVSLRQLAIQTTDATNGNFSLWAATGLSAGDWVLKVGTLAAQRADNVTITGGSISGITDLAVADGGTGASTIAGALTNLTLPTLTPTGGVLDWAVADKYIQSLTGNQIYTFANTLDGKELELNIVNVSGTPVPTFPTVKWEGNVTPTPSGNGKTDTYWFRRRGSVIYGRSSLNYTT